MKNIVGVLLLGLAISSCGDNHLEKKGFQVNEITEDANGQKVVGLPIDSLHFATQPRNVLATYYATHRLTPIYKVNYNKKTQAPFTGSNTFYTNWYATYNEGDNWNQNFMPGIEAVHGYNFVNVSHYNTETQKAHTLFQKPVLIKTLYYPAFSKDSLHYKPVQRDFYMVSVYDEDTNKDGYVNATDLRRLYYFDIEGLNKKALIPKSYAVMSSEYDSANDYMYIFAKKDENQNGQMELTEPTYIFYIDLKNPENVGLQYAPE